ncbi:F0F1 ATP synthase subunit B [Frankia sp. CNm7]|uniref:ATP synthase subunit b n=1 Tax=Frankia nepalensis TaxID=1836974 RepID=A0A937RPR3_9ACTN|nr:F0F1 ATP synthase subunit B [Frankia nepalensis]MBL7499716.1 F0F1 ATP synthase subunit B [Frankia nepalensis]MBL7510898.1 F0F1 ATP synthase subunit B [Frankia nepalensis]MBL7521386.1 F0F1 ATP synthase subunit B [Frankia nepalensis]MBL7630398.1 F0F1 ATP synthase subunit B [Frankia nepalensis]
MSVTSTFLLAAEHTTESGGHGDENVLIPPIGELIIGTVAFGLLVAFFFWKIRPQVQKFYAERTERIEGGLLRAEAAQREAQALIEQYRAQLAEARAEAGRIRDEATVQGRQIIAELREQADREVAEIRARGEAQLVAERSQIVSALRAELGGVALELATKIVGHELTQTTEHRRLIDDFIAELDTSGETAAAAPAGSGG